MLPVRGTIRTQFRINSNCMVHGQLGFIFVWYRYPLYEALQIDVAYKVSDSYRDFEKKLNIEKVLTLNMNAMHSFNLKGSQLNEDGH